MSLPFLLEIGTEEIPDWMIISALNQLQDSFQSLLDTHALGGRVSWVDATPRRLALRADQLIERQQDTEELLLGPPKSAGLGAAAGFAKKMGATPEALATTTTAKGEYFSYTRTILGRPSREILAAELPGLILKIQWPKAMYWTGGKSGPRFIRPIRWLVALLGTETVSFEIAGVHTGAQTRGHRRLGQDSILVTPDTYRDQLAGNGVILSAEARRQRIEAGIAALLASTPGLQVRRDPDLLHTLIHITEFPTPVMGQFDPQYLELPSEVLVTVMRHHQKYFSVEDAAGNLAPHFIAVMNTAADPDGLVRRGNERVLRARFNDARFFWTQDQHKPLATRIDDLKNVTFQAKLGSYFEKTERVAQLARELAAHVQTDPAPVERAARLAKTDLTTEMVKEFTELQGVVGGLYAKAQGEPEDVWRAVYDQYKPASMDDSIPATLAGQILSLADKTDTLRGFFRLGLIPKGGGDPFALRRAAQGVVRILTEAKLEIPLSTFAGGDAPLADFLLDRVRYYFREFKGYKYDEVNAVLAAGRENLPDVEARLGAVQAVRPTEDFEPLAASFKRIQNILKQAGFTEAGPTDETLLEAGPEKQLYESFCSIARNLPYTQTLEQIAALRPAVDLFFDKVLVNAPDPNIRRNRLLLLRNILTESSTIADLSEIVTQ
jgi:glycyl-tRNA synthetase beta chain